MKAKVYVNLKSGVLDPQGKAIQHSVELLGFSGISDIRQGKYFEISLDGTLDQQSARESIEKMAREVLRAQVAELLTRTGANDTEARAVREHMAVLDQRLTNVSTELANQLSELGRDIDGLGQRIPEVAEGTVSDEVVDALRGGQVKLANEQARYEIAFRQDLATLAEPNQKTAEVSTEQPAQTLRHLQQCVHRARPTAPHRL